MFKLLRQTNLELNCQLMSHMQCPTARKKIFGLCDSCFFIDRYEVNGGKLFETFTYNSVIKY